MGNHQELKKREKIVIFPPVFYGKLLLSHERPKQFSSRDTNCWYAIPQSNIN